jgi:CheY-like chemotaxis protein
MTTALVVEDDDRDMAAIEDTLCSMQQQFHRVTNQMDAMQRLSEREYDYAIVDLRIPARPDRKRADIEFGGNLLRDIRRTVPDSKLPVIVLADDVNCFTMARWLIDRGVSDFVSKPFQSTHELGDVIRRVLKKNDRIEIVPMVSVEAQTPRFAGGELSISRNEACLLGIPIVAKGVSGHCLNILQLLSQRGLDGSYIARSADDLAAQLGTLGGQVAVAGYVRSIRRNITERLRRSIGIDCQRDDVIERTPGGYRLRSWINVTQRHSDDRENTNLSATAAAQSASGLNIRQAWVIQQLAQGAALERRLIEQKFHVHQKTAKRDLSELVRRRLIEYVRDGMGGHYRLLETRLSA